MAHVGGKRTLSIYTRSHTPDGLGSSLVAALNVRLQILRARQASVDCATWERTSSDETTEGSERGGPTMGRVSQMSVCEIRALFAGVERWSL